MVQQQQPKERWDRLPARGSSLGAARACAGSTAGARRAARTGWRGQGWVFLLLLLWCVGSRGREVEEVRVEKSSFDRKEKKERKNGSIDAPPLDSAPVKSGRLPPSIRSKTPPVRQKKQTSFSPLKGEDPFLAPWTPGPRRGCGRGRERERRWRPAASL